MAPSILVQPLQFVIAFQCSKNTAATHYLKAQVGGGPGAVWRPAPSTGASGARRRCFRDPRPAAAETRFTCWGINGASTSQLVGVERAVVGLVFWASTLRTSFALVIAP